MTTVTVDIRKYDGRLSARWTTARLGSDAHGIWLATAEGVPVASRSGGWTTRFPYVMVVPQEAWWTATFCRAPGPEIYCDVGMPAQWSPDGTALRLVDLDLDVVRLEGADPHVEDEDEFAEHRRLLAYPDDLVTEALRTCTWLQTATRRDAATEPFSTTYRHWLARADSSPG